jgi:hypothetical protein
MPNAAQLMGDIPKYTNVEPTIEISMVKSWPYSPIFRLDQSRVAPPSLLEGWVLGLNADWWGFYLSSLETESTA